MYSLHSFGKSAKDVVFEMSFFQPGNVLYQTSTFASMSKSAREGHERTAFEARECSPAGESFQPFAFYIVANNNFDLLELIKDIEL